MLVLSIKLDQLLDGNTWWKNGYENLGMMDHSIEMFWTCVSKHLMILVMKMMRHEHLQMVVSTNEGW